MAITINGSGTVSGITAGLTAAAMPAGSVLQVVQATTQTGSEITSDTDFFSCSITPTASSSNVLVNAILQIGGACNPNGGFQLKRGSTPINITSSQYGSSVDAMWTMDDFGHPSNNANKAMITALPVVFLDTGISTTSATTYTFRTTSVSSFMFNRDTHNGSSGYATSIFQLWEIAA